MPAKCTNCRSKDLCDAGKYILCLSCGHSYGETLSVKRMATDLTRKQDKLARNKAWEALQQQNTKKNRTP